MIHSLQALTRNMPRAFAAVDMHETIRHILQIARSELTCRDVSLELDLAAEHSHVHGDAVQLQQVLLNLVLNAIDAMAPVRERPRVLRLATTAVAGAQQQLQVCIEDNGQGLASDAASRMFEPFYTTKANGMGMGLAICRSIVEAHKGSIQAAQRLPFGALFMFRLPLVLAAEP
jgi:C4-dicarboxylate-specific signal transduction histidine kinase